MHTMGWKTVVIARSRTTCSNVIDTASGRGRPTTAHHRPSIGWYHVTSAQAYDANRPGVRGHGTAFRPWVRPGVHHKPCTGASDQTGGEHGDESVSVQGLDPAGRCCQDWMAPSGRARGQRTVSLEVKRLHLGTVRVQTERWPVHGFVVTYPGGAALVDTGVGGPPDLIRDWDVVNVTAAEALAGLGLVPGDIDLVINTHLHFDHCGQNAVFKHAAFYVQRAELERCQRESPALYDCVRAFRTPASSCWTGTPRSGLAYRRSPPPGTPRATNRFWSPLDTAARTC